MKSPAKAHSKTRLHRHLNTHLDKQQANFVIVVAALTGVIIGLVGVLVLRPHFVTIAYRNPRINALGDQAAMGNLQISVDHVRTDNVGDSVYLPGAGYHYTIVNLRIKNTGNTALPIAPVVQTFLRDATGNNYLMAPAPMDNPLQAGTLEPGQSRSGELSYNVPDTANNLTFLFTDPGRAPVAFSL